ncbi:hypothetical protein PHYC_00886 [Phycisphaerales bacterium]|nr:hypothetical protein PHYC_00886 [Phycisphaerales bacterium]
MNQFCRGRVMGVVSVAVGAVVAAGMIAGAPREARPSPGAPVSVAIVDVAQVIRGLQEFSDRENAVMAKMEGYKKNLKELEDRIKQIENEIQNTIPKEDTSSRVNKLGERLEMKALIETRGKAYDARINLEQGGGLHAMYAKVIDAVSQLAKKEGIDLVISDDRRSMTDPTGSYEQNESRVASRQVLFASESLSITDRVTTIMNNDYLAGKGAAPAPVPAENK